MWLEKLILKEAEKRLEPYRIRANQLKKEFSNEYRECLPRIKQYYGRAFYWHGTGRYHYRHNEESRYITLAEGITDVLKSIVERSGLIPHIDPWVSVDSPGTKTVSLGTVRMHSRLFARIHQYEENSLLYELRSVTYWIRLYFTLLFFWLIASPRNTLQFVKSLFRESFYKDIQTWASAIRKPRGAKVINVRDMVSGNVPGSDIKENYPIIFGIAKDNTKVTGTIPLVHAVEVRSTQPITLLQFTHIEVPLDKVSETKEFLSDNGISLEILPMEYVDMYLSNIPLKNLAYT